MDYHEPWSVEFGEYAGYDGMSSGYKVSDATGKLLFVIDTVDFPLDAPPSHLSCGPSAAAQAVADRIVMCVNATAGLSTKRIYLCIVKGLD